MLESSDAEVLESGREKKDEPICIMVTPTEKREIKAYANSVKSLNMSRLFRRSVRYAMKHEMFRDTLPRRREPREDRELTHTERETIENMPREIKEASELLCPEKTEEFSRLLTEELWNVKWYEDNDFYLSFVELLKIPLPETSFGDIVHILLHCLERRTTDPAKETDQKAFSVLGDIILDESGLLDQRRRALKVCGAMEDEDGNLYPPSKGLLLQLASESDDEVYKELRIATRLTRGRTMEELFGVHRWIDKKLKEEGDGPDLQERLAELYTSVNGELSHRGGSLMDERRDEERSDLTEKG